MNNKNMTDSLNHLKAAFQKVNKEWEKCEKMNNLVDGEYPFKKSFDELNLEVSNWVDESISELSR